MLKIEYNYFSKCFGSTMRFRYRIFMQTSSLEENILPVDLSTQATLQA